MNIELNQQDKGLNKEESKDDGADEVLLVESVANNSVLDDEQRAV